MANLLSQRPQNDADVFARGVALHRAGHLREAEAHYQGILRRNPQHADALNAMGTLSVEAGKIDFAIAFFESALKLKPCDFRFLNNLGNILVDAHRTEEGLPYLEKALQLRPSTYELMCNIGRAYRKMGVGARGLPFLRRAVAMRPRQVDGLAALAESLVSLGEYEEAEKYYHAFVKLGGPRHLALYGLAMSRKQTAETRLQTDIDQELAKPDLAVEARVSLHYARAKVGMDLREPDTAWPHLVAANALAGARYDLNRHDIRQHALTALFSATFIASRRAYGSSSQRPVFIVGMPRSGTSLTEQILASHADIVGAGELSYVHTIANRLFYSMGDLELFTDKVRALSASGVEALAGEYLGKIGYFSADAARITDKMPHNFSLLGLIGILFPRARIIYCKRDPLDNCFSIYSNMLSAGHSYGNDLETLGRYYRRHVDLMKHWQAVMGDQIMEVQYEGLVDDVEGVSRQMVNFIGLPWDPACLQYFANERSVATISKWQVRQPIYKTSVARWKAYEQHLGPLKRGLGDLVTGDA